MHRPDDHGSARRLGGGLACSAHGPAGFTLIELMLVIAVIGVLAAIAYPSYQDQALRARRTDAVVATTQIQQAQERWRANHTSYADQATLTTPPSATPPGLGFAAESPKGYYTLAVTDATGTGYTLTATAVAGRAQSGDTGCTVLTVTVLGGAATSTPANCWSR